VSVEVGFIIEFFPSGAGSPLIYRSKKEGNPHITFTLCLGGGR